MSQSGKHAGIDLLITRYKKMFRIPENLNHYSEDDFRLAEKKFLKYALMEGKNLIVVKEHHRES